MVFVCGICNKTFKTIAYLKNHLKNSVPCNYVCKNCGEKKGSYDAYVKHIRKKDCTPKEYSDSEVESMNIPVITKNVGVQINGDVNQNNVNFYINLGDVDKSYIKHSGIHPHEYVSPVDIERFEQHVMSIVIEFLKLHGKKPIYLEQELTDLLSDIVKLFHSNLRYPQYLNIMDDNAGSDRNKIYSGDRFVEDVLSKINRNKRVLARIHLCLKSCCNKCVDDLPSCYNFIKTQLIPYVLHCYVTNSNYEDLQKTWQANKQILDEIQYDTYPKCRENDILTRDDLMQQALELVNDQTSIYAEYLAQQAYLIQKDLEKYISNK